MLRELGAEDNGHYSALKIETALDAADTQTLHRSKPQRFLKICSFHPQAFWHTTQPRRHLCIRLVLRSCSAQLFLQ